MADKIGYSVLCTSSNDTSHDGQELEIRNSTDCESNHNKGKNKGKGWQSARFCEYPQHLVITLNSATEISQIQILSHQSKIASKIEIWVGLDHGTHDSSTYKSIDWKRLGYLSLDKNERSNWKARELKSVYINTTANYIKFSLHESHINTINLFNQIGIVALTVLGKASSQHEQTIDSNLKKKSLSININDENTKYNHNDRDTDTDVDHITSNKIRELVILKKKAVENEDYDEAKRCKISIENLRNSSKQLSKLEKEKKIAVEKEDYDTAKALKLQIERLRAMSLNPDKTDPIHPIATHHIAPTATQHNLFANQPSNTAYHPYHHPSQQNMVYPPSNQSNMYNAPHSQSAQPTLIGNMESPHSVHFNPPQQQQQQQQQPIAMGHSRSHSHSMSASPHRPHHLNNNNGRLSASIPPDERQIRPMKSNYNTVDVSSSNPFGDDATKEDASVSFQLQPQTQPPIQTQTPIQPQTQMTPNTSALQSNNTSIHMNNDAPKPLKGSVKKGSEKSIEIFGEYTIRLLNSTNWNHRDEGLKAITSFLNKNQHPDARMVFKLSSKWIYGALQDRVAGVLLSGIDTLNTLISVYGNHEVDDNDICKSLQSIIITLVNILGHSNSRLIDASGSMLISLCHHNDAVCRQIYNILIKKMKKLLPKHLKGRGLILLQLIPQFHLPKGVDLNAMMDHLIHPQLHDKNGNVRDIGIQITGLLYQINDIRHRLVQYLESGMLNDFIKETLNSHFEEISGTANVLEREPKSTKEQSRPSKAMNRTSNTQKKPTKKKKRRRTQQKKSDKHSQKERDNNEEQNMKQKQDHVDNVYPTEQQEAEGEDVCNFCGLRDASFMENEENLDLHYWQSCPMLTSCKLCEQVIEIATLHEHILTECESGINHELCTQCNVPYVVDQAHECHGNNNSNPMCPLCLNNIPSGVEPWKQHLLKYPGCNANPRPLSQ